MLDGGADADAAGSFVNKALMDAGDEYIYVTVNTTVTGLGLLSSYLMLGPDQDVPQTVNGVSVGNLTNAIGVTAIGPNMTDLGPENAMDLALVMRNVHTFMAEGYAEKAFQALFRVLRPGGVLGVEEHRARSTGLQDPRAGDGYVQEAYVRALAQDAGFEFAGSSDVNANPKDTKDHPFGVWTLPPVLRTAPLGMPDNPSFDSKPYLAIGESDRMTLKFIKPGGAAPKR
jgi:predicted methyltransferase